VQLWIGSPLVLELSHVNLSPDRAAHDVMIPDMADSVLAAA
jgi:hypothetical protein